MGLLTMIHLFARPCLIPPGGKTYFWDDNSCDPISGATSVKLQQLKRITKVAHYQIFKTPGTTITLCQREHRSSIRPFIWTKHKGLKQCFTEQTCLPDLLGRKRRAFLTCFGEQSLRSFRPICRRVFSTGRIFRQMGA